MEKSTQDKTCRRHMRFSFRTLSDKSYLNPIVFSADNATEDSLHSNDLLSLINCYLKYIPIASDLTLEAKINDLRKFYAFAEYYNSTQNIHSWDTQFTQAFVDALQIEYETTSVYRIMSTVRCFCKYLIDNEIIRPLSNPIRNIKLAVVEPKYAKRLDMKRIAHADSISMSSKEKFDLLLTGARLYNETRPRYSQNLLYRNIAIISLLFYTGVNLFQLCDLEMSQLDARRDADDGWVRNVKCRGEKIRQIYLNKECMSALSDYIKKVRGDAPGYIFVSRTFKKLERSIIAIIVKKIAEKASELLPDGVTMTVSPRSFRGELGSKLRALRSEEEVAKFLGLAHKRVPAQYEPTLEAYA